MENEISTFIHNVGAKEPSPSSANYWTFRSIFKRPNYFIYNGRFIIVKISRSTKPFFGVGKAYIDLLNNLQDYLLVLIVSEREGWVYNKNEVNRMITGGYWNLRLEDNQYKINSHTLKQNHWFNNAEHFLTRTQNAAA